MTKKLSQKTKVLEFKTHIEKDEDGFFVASVPAIPGCHTQGDTYEEAIKNVKEAIELCLEVAQEDPSYGEKITWPKTKTTGKFVLNVPVQFPI
ncbi:MAG: type II toxin-antitoxin system HicB family antitoxin [bacterium]|nr:type II toxin-antitoxin system HicB family antitoxin [bacterium]